MMRGKETCDSCSKLRVKCHWESTDISLRCRRCSEYGLDCVFNGIPWTSSSTSIFQSSAPDTSTRSIYWGPSSNAGGHPLDLHSSRAPLSTPDVTTSNQMVPSLNPSFTDSSTAKGTIRLDISPRVRDHLFGIFFESIQPAWPVVTKDSLVRYPPTVLLEAAILGVAARHHTAIASWRDFAHLQDVIDSEVRALFGLRCAYEPSIQTLQALLLLSLRVELCSRSHRDFQRFSFRVSFACRMAQDLKCHLPESTGNGGPEEALRKTLWAACIFMDSYFSAVLGQDMNISRAHDDDFSLSRGPAQPGFFRTAVGFMACLRPVLRMGYSVLPHRDSTLYQEATANLSTIQWHQQYLETHKGAYSEYEFRFLQMMHSNTHLLFILGLRLATTPGDPYQDKIQAIVGSQTSWVVIQACQTLEWSTPELMHSIPGQLLVTLYSTTRALMVVVDVLRDRNCETAFSESVVRCLRGAVVSARAFMEFLALDKTWGKHWTQTHTLKAVFARLDCDSPVDETVPLLSSLPGMEPPSLETATAERDAYEYVDWDGFEGDFSNVILNPADWEDFFAQYDQGLNLSLPEYQS
ncbi:hypothetical protein ASPZODRAFT_895076 [Penicilliopsis zonata CBS 506.65]|uniref:Zn(2)-C6 fungal-type domain-containing protein n=1 Tax=Penicilliopsis zonata CBS 506.65 TaxID=1073090 RepID=A0A1L9S8Q3_9EURO|nr:hypothetical protein ASPZODRAFT_895076 [Penicilliopsis zonata CBS 506.65]OJJ43542.1 hypothetical protein ASPZODRAFT_895076 [Penicilliopsis zonata CBS 506.65]